MDDDPFSGFERSRTRATADEYVDLDALRSAGEKTGGVSAREVPDVLLLHPKPDW